ncbi:two-component system response regulator YesN [Paenibacillus endophyticus]|uniref:Two-component system response regulator YesN n=1 Tax=Paenibacillus endophyticus TaxID=1294268 RepID=A0A7W5G8Z1_9BACL|nr:response regulator [Paenibacillus endophyticus]MBB3151165.1 two-component system response regulator YesN [Paenibacillus endophyticus]
MIQALIVDDESLVRKGMRLMFPWSKFGVEIAGEAATGERAMAFLRSHPVQLMMTDITMPGMTGLELMKQAQAHDPALKVVILTCHQDFEFIQEALRLGAIDYIVKTQLEEIDLDVTMERILKAVRQDTSSNHSTKEKLVLARTAAANASADLQWIMEDDRFSVISHAINELEQAGSRESYSILAAAAERWKRSFPMFDWDRRPSLPTSGGAASWLQGLRSELAAWLRSSAYSEDVIRAVVKAVELIAEHPGQHMKQSEICQLVSLSKSYFSTSFRDIMRLTFSHYLQTASLNAAKELLLSTNHPVYLIAEKCGFMDQRYFSKLFKEQTGMLPSEFRQQQTGRS